MKTARLPISAALGLKLALPAAATAGTDVAVDADPPGTVQNEVRITRAAGCS